MHAHVRCQLPRSHRPAESISLWKYIGSFEAGKLADLLALDANLLDDITNSSKISLVMKNGRLHDALTLDEVYPRQQPLGQQR